MASERNVIISAGMAAVAAAVAMREAGFNGEILMLGDEDELPYHRPPLSKHFLGPEPMSREELAIQPSDFFRDQRVELERVRKVLGLDLAGHRLLLAGGRQVGFDRALIAVGARPRRLNVPGAELDGVLYLRRLADATQLSGALSRSGRVVIIGAGLIGLELASAARSFGKEVTVLEASPAPLRRVLDRQVGAIVAQIHRDHGVDLRLQTAAAALVGGKTVSGVTTGDGTFIPADLVVVAIGVEPNVEWLAGSGVAHQDGVLVNERTETMVPGLFAAGDVARAWNPRLGRRLRLEQVGNARAQGAAAGYAMAGRPQVYAPLPAVGSQQHRQKINVLGLPDDRADIILRGSPEKRSLIAFYLAGGHVVGAASLDRARDLPALRALVESGKRPAVEELRDEDTPIDRL